jgi:FMN phosphatase YigB (HAD superfamily)
MSTNLFKKKLFVLFLALNCIISSIQPAVVIFDMEGVLVKKSSAQVGWHIGLRNFFGFYNPFKLEQRLFNFLDLLEPRNPNTPQAYRSNMLLPQIMCDWLCGDKTTTEIQRRINEGLTTYGYFFSSPTEKNLIRATTAFMFNPSLLARVMYPVKDGVKLLKQCYRKKNQAGERANKVYILSNWDPESFDILLQRKIIRRMLKYCDGIIISGQVHMMKPDPEIFELLFNTFNVSPDEELTIFIDDQEENIQAACDLGKEQFTAIHCKNFNHRPVNKELKRLDVI